jgi:hypothetical protein
MFAYVKGAQLNRTPEIIPKYTQESQWKCHYRRFP